PELTPLSLHDALPIYVDELADAVLRELAAVARLLDAAERQPRIRLHQAVDEHGARLDLGRQALGPRVVPGPERRAQAELRVVGQAYRVRLVLGADHRGHRPERFLVEGRHALVDRSKQGGR